MSKTQLSGILPDMTIAEEKLQNYINDHADQLAGITSSKLAEFAGVSQSTVIKYSQKLGYPSFKRMILDITTTQPDDELDDELDPNESTLTTASKLCDTFSRVFKITTQLNSAVNIEKAANAINQAEIVYVYAHNTREATFARYLSSELMRIGIRTIHSQNTAEETIQVSLCTNRDVIILLSKSGETREMVNFARHSHKRGAFIISITRAQKNKLGKCSDINLKTVEYRNRTYIRERIVSMSYRYLIDWLTLAVIKLRPEEAEKQILTTRLLTKPAYIEKE